MNKPERFRKVNNAAQGTHQSDCFLVGFFWKNVPLVGFQMQGHYLNDLSIKNPTKKTIEKANPSQPKLSQAKPTQAKLCQCKPGQAKPS